MTLSASTSDVKIASYNVLNPPHALKWKTKPGYEAVTQEDGTTTNVDNWAARKKLVINVIEAVGADVLCFQEVSIATKEFFEQQLRPIYSCAGYQQHNYENPYDPFSMGNALFYNNTKFECTRSTTYLSVLDSEKNGKPATRGEMYADFRDKSNHDVKFRVASTHLDGYWRQEPDQAKKEAGRSLGCRELQEVVQTIEKDAEHFDFVAIAGDFNEGYEQIDDNSSRLKFLMENGYVTDDDRSISEPLTGTRIDHIFVKAMREGMGMCVEPLFVLAEERASDHLMVASVVKTWIA